MINTQNVEFAGIVKESKESLIEVVPLFKFENPVIVSPILTLSSFAYPLTVKFDEVTLRLRTALAGFGRPPH